MSAPDDTAERAARLTAWQARGYRRSPSHACLLRLGAGRCNGRHCPTMTSDWADHVDLWLRRDGRPACLTSQPYGLDEAARRHLDLLCTTMGLRWRAEPEQSWHCPGGTTLVVIEPVTPLLPRPTRPPDGLRSTPRRASCRDAAVFPEAHAANRRQGAPHTYWLRVTPAHVTITHDYFFVPPDVADRIAGLYGEYVHQWRNRRRDFPRRGLGWGGFRDYCSVTVRREDARWWLDLFRAAAALCYDPWQRERAARGPGAA